MIIIKTFYICGPGLDYISFLKAHEIPQSCVVSTCGITEGRVKATEVPDCLNFNVFGLPLCVTRLKENTDTDAKFLEGLTQF